MTTTPPEFGPAIEEFVHHLPRRIVFRTFFIHDGKALCVGITDDDKQFGLYHTSRTNDFDSVDRKSIGMLDGLPFLIGRRDGKAWVAHGEQEFGPYDEILEMRIESDKLFFKASVDGKTVIGYNGVSYEPFEEISEPYFFDDFVKFIGINGKEKHVVCGEYKYGPFSKIKKLSVIGSAPCFMALHEDKWYVIFGEATYGPFVKTEKLSVVVGQPLFIARHDDNIVRVHHGDDIGPILKEITHLTTDGLNLLYVSVAQNGENFVVLGDKQYGPFTEITKPAIYLGQPLYCAKVDEREKVFLGDIEVGDFQKVEHLQVASEEIIVVAKISKGKHQVFCGDYQSDVWQAVDQVVYKDGQLAYSAQRGGSWFVVFEETTLGPYKGVSELDIVDGKLFFVEQLKPFKNVHFGDECYGPYKKPEEIQIIDDKPFFFAKTADWRSLHLVVYGDEESPPSHGILGARVTNEGKILVLSRGVNNDKRYVYYDGQKGPEFGFINFKYVKMWDGKPFYRAWSQNTGGEVYVIYGTEAYGPYEQIGVAFVKDGKVVITAKKGEKILFIFDNHTKEWNIKNVDDIKNIELRHGDPIYKVFAEGKFFSVWGSNIGMPYDYIHRIRVFNGSLLYEASVGSRSFIVFDGQEVSRDYEEIRSLEINEDGICCYVKISNELHRVTIPFVP